MHYAAFSAEEVKCLFFDQTTAHILLVRERLLREALKDLDHSKIQESMLKRGVKWIFNTPAASHHGGVWESQIRTVRKVLSPLLKQQVLDDEGLQTLLYEVESIINDRPITTASNDRNDMEALTPLLMRTQPNIPPGVFSKDDLYACRRWRQIQYMADLFWCRWTQEYLPRCRKDKRNSPQRLCTDEDKHTGETPY